jgi:hypothetical protein
MLVGTQKNRQIATIAHINTFFIENSPWLNWLKSEKRAEYTLHPPQKICQMRVLRVRYY